MNYNINKLPDFYSVRNFNQLEYSFEGMENKTCYLFFDNGFSSNLISTNTRDIKFIWDGFLLFVDSSISLDDIKNGVDLYNERIVALQRTNYFSYFNNSEVRNWIINKLNTLQIPFFLMPDTNRVNGYPSSCDLWSTREASVLLDATSTTGDGNAYYFYNPIFEYNIKFNITQLPDLLYRHNGALVLKGNSSNAIIRLVENDFNLKEQLENIIGEEKLYSMLEQRMIPGITIEKINNEIKR